MIIYSINHKDTKELIYIGSTCTKLCDRISAHHRSYIKKQSHVHRLMTESGGWDMYEFKIISQHIGITRQELFKLEKVQIHLYNPPDNCHKNPYRTREEKIEYNKKYNQDNADIAKQRIAQPYICICGRTVTTGEKSRHFKSNHHMKYVSLVE